jgi:ABC-type multidrug transport system ATPase subunit
MLSVDREPLLARPEGSSFAKKAYVLTMFNMRVAIVKKRHTQIFIPLMLYLVMLSGTKALIKDQWFPEVVHTALWEPGTKCQVYPDSDQKLAVACDGNLDTCSMLANQTAFHLGVNSYTLFKSRSDLMLAMREAEGSFYGGVTFTGNNNITVTLPTLQQPMASAPASNSPLTCRSSGSIDFPCEVEQYMSGCFLTFQLAAQRALGDKVDSVIFRMFPMHKMFVSGLQASSVIWLVPLYLCFLLINIFNLVLVDVVTEKEQRLRDILQVNGISSALYLVSWSITNFVFGGTAITAIAVTVKYGGLFPLSDVGTVLLPTALFFLCLSSLAYILSYKLETARAASITGSICDVVLVGTGAVLVANKSIGPWFYWIPSVPFFQVLNNIGLIESRGLAASLNTDDVFYPVIALLVDALILTGIAFAIGSKSAPATQTHALTQDVALQVSDLKKTYSPDIIALAGVSFTVSPGETVVLLGNNGAGKTTLIKTVLGLLEPSGGWYQHSDSVAVCFQENTFWEKLSVRDHLQFFANLHGLANYRTDLADELELTQCLAQGTETLSGGQKRRLAFAIALQNPSASLLVLDEPSSGVDVEGRRKFWSLLERDPRAKLLTTHYLDEAEALGDRQVIMADGKVVAAGKSDQLKRQFGEGHILTIEPFNEVAMDLVKTSFGREAIALDNPGSFRIPFNLSERITSFLQQVERRIPSASTSVRLSTLESVIAQLTINRAGSEVASATELLAMVPHGTGISNNSKKVIALAWMRIVGQVHSFGSFANQFLAPLFLVTTSFLLGRVNSIIGQPEWAGWNPINFADWHRVTNATRVPIDIPVSAAAQLLKPLPSIFNAVPVTGPLDRFLLNATLDAYYPFAIDVGNMIWVNPANPHIPPLAAATVSSIDGLVVSSAPLLSVVAMTFTPQLISFIIYFVLTLVRVSVVAGTLAAEERFQGVQRHLKLHGLSSRQYWLGTLLGHMALNVPVILGTLAIAWYGFGHLLSLPGTPLLLATTAVVNSFQLIIFSYLQSGLFTDRDTFMKWYPALAATSAEFVTLGCTSFVTATAGKSISIWFHFFASLLVPQYPLCGAIAYAALQHTLCTAEGTHPSEFVCSSPLGLFATDAALPLVVGLIQASLMFGLLLYYQGDRPVSSDSTRWLQNPPRALAVTAEAEESRIVRGSDDEILFLQLWHTHDNRKWAVKGLSVGCSRGQCLGLLGTNGAGKTTAIGALTGSTKPTAGYAGIAPSVTTGFCPQFDCHWPTVSAANHAKFYGVLRGIGPAAALRGLKAVELDDSADKLVKDFSGGMRRRLAVYLALLGRPDVLVLDEPTTGVDLEGKRRVWILLKAMTRESAVLLTTHSMEEAERLCNKVCLMHEGSVIQVGSPAKLRLDDGLIISLSLTATSNLKSEALQAWLSESLALQVDNLGGDKFRVKREQLLNSELFKFLQESKARGDIESFELAPTTLEDSFLATVENFKSSQ